MIHTTRTSPPLLLPYRTIRDKKRYEHETLETVENPSLPFKTKLYNYAQRPRRQLQIELSDLSRTNWRLIETETDQRISLEDPGGALNVFLFVSGSSVYPRLETIPGSSSLYLLSVFDIFHKYLSKDSAQQLRAHLTSGKTSSNTRNSLALETVSISKYLSNLRPALYI